MRTVRHSRTGFARALGLAGGLLFACALALAAPGAFDQPAALERLEPGSTAVASWTLDPEVVRSMDEAELVLSLDGGATYPVRLTGRIEPGARSTDLARPGPSHRTCADRPAGRPRRAGGHRGAALRQRGIRHRLAGDAAAGRTLRRQRRMAHPRSPRGRTRPGPRIDLPVAGPGAGARPARRGRCRRRGHGRRARGRRRRGPRRSHPVHPPPHGARSPDDPGLSARGRRPPATLDALLSPQFHRFGNLFRERKGLQCFLYPFATE